MFHFVAGNKMLYFLIQARFLRPPVVFRHEGQEEQSNTNQSAAAAAVNENHSGVFRINKVNIFNKLKGVGGEYLLSHEEEHKTFQNIN